MRISISRIFVAVSLLLLAIPALADTLELKDGRVIHGRYLGGTQINIRFEVDGKLQLFPVKDVLAITFEAAARPVETTGAAPAKAPAKAAAKTATVAEALTVPAGTRLVVRMIDSVDSDTNKIGDSFRASLEEDLLVGDVVVAAKKSDVHGKLVEAKEAGRLAGRSELRLELTEIVIGGQPHAIVTGDYEATGESRGKDTAKKVGIGAAVGAAVGAIAGGGKGAAIGAGVGAGAGTAIQILTRGEQVKVPSETMLEFTLEQPFIVRVAKATPR